MGQTPSLTHLPLSSIAVDGMFEVALADGSQHLKAFGTLTEDDTQWICREGVAPGCKKRLDGLTATEALLLRK